MIVTVRLFARARELAECESLMVEVPEGATVANLRGELGKQVPALASFVQRCAVAVDAEFARDEVVLKEGSDVALIPPVSGG
jgi:molybdopterin converting factor subunit 1